MDEEIYKKDGAICKNWYNEKEGKNKSINTLIKNEQRKIDNFNNFNNNNRSISVGPSFLGKTYLMLKHLQRMPDRDLYIIAKSSPEQNSNSEIKSKK